MAGACNSPSLSSPLPAFAVHTRETVAEGTNSVSSFGLLAAFLPLSSRVNQPLTVLQPDRATTAASSATRNNAGLRGFLWGFIGFDVLNVTCSI